MNRRGNTHRIVIGRAESISYVQHAIPDVPAKIDTGAYHSAVHASEVKLSSNGKSLSFVLLGGHPVCGELSISLTTDKFRQVTVANSFGAQELRYEVRLRIKLGPKIFTSPFTLADRSKKLYPILVGRELLNKRFVVDSSITNINKKALKQKYNVTFPVDDEGEERG